MRADTWFCFINYSIGNNNNIRIRDLSWKLNFIFHTLIRLTKQISRTLRQK